MPAGGRGPRLCRTNGGWGGSRFCCLGRAGQCGSATRLRRRISAVMQWAEAQGYREDDPAKGHRRGAAEERRPAQSPSRLAVGQGGRRHRGRAAVRGASADAAGVRVPGTDSVPERRGARRAVEGGGPCGTGMAHSTRADEDGAGAPGSRVHTRARGTQRGERVANGSEMVLPSPMGRPLNEVANSKLVRQLGIGAVPNGFRSSFRDWAAERSDAPREVCEPGLVHVNTNRIKAAYRRTDLFERRRALMEQWAVFFGA